MTIDTDASTDVMNKVAFQKIKQTQPIKLTEDRCQIVAYDSQSQLRKFGDNIRANCEKVTSTIHVFQGTYGFLLSYAMASELLIVDIKINNVTSCSNSIEQYLSPVR